MLIIFFGGQLLITQIGVSTGLWSRLNINQFFAGSFSIGFIFGSYMAEAFRAAYLTIPKGQIDAAKAFGMRPSTWLKEIVWPQFVPVVLTSRALADRALIYRALAHHALPAPPRPSRNL